MKIKIDKPKATIPATLAHFPKYTTFLINQASQTAHATRPSQVGQLTELFPQYEKNTIEMGAKPSIEGWKQFHEQNVPDALKNSFPRAKDMIEKFKEAITEIDDDMIVEWIEDLLYEKTFYGLSVELVIREFLKKKYKIESRKATPEEESQNIDFAVGTHLYQIKPSTLKSKVQKHLNPNVSTIFYNNLTDEVEFEIDDPYLLSLIGDK
jgi:hypothetical protein